MRLKKTEMAKLLNTNHVVPLWKRALAFIIDLIILEAIILTPLQQIVTHYLFNDATSWSSLLHVAENVQPFQKEIIVLSVIMSFIGFAYFVLLEGLTQQTAGKMILNIRVTSNGHAPNWGQVMGRNITKATTMTSFSLLFLIDVIYLLFKKDQRLSDKLFNTRVEQ